MKIAVVSNTDIRCGLGEHGRGVANALRKKFEVDELTTCPQSGYDVVFINYLAGNVMFSVPEVQELRRQGTKVIVIWNDAPSFHVTNDRDSLQQVDFLVTHEPVEVVGGHLNRRYIEIGMTQIWDLPEFKVESGPSIGTAGFPFASKKMDVVIRAAQNIQGQAVMITPQHRFQDPTPLWQNWKDTLGDKLVLVTDWLEQADVIRRLSQCAMCMYYANEDFSTGQSGSARMILASGRPTIIRRCRKISPLSLFENEMYLVDTEHEAANTAFQIWQDLLEGRPVKRPNLVRKITSWEMVGKAYIELVEELTRKNE